MVRASNLSTRRQAISQLGAFLAASPLLKGQFVPREGHRRVPSLDELATVFEFEPVARGNITQSAYDFVAGGVESEASVRRNREAFHWLTLLPRVMAGVSPVDASTSVLGHEIAYPILVAPTAAHSQLHPDGERETHRGATAAHTTMLVSSVASFGIQEIADAAAGPLWSQLYVHRNPERAREKVERAGEAGCQAICLTVDAQYSSHRDRMLHDRNLGRREMRRAVERSRGRRRRRSTRQPPNPYRLRPESPDLDWSFIATLRAWTSLPIVLKGLLAAEDARLAVEHGADAIVVSNHGARYLHSVPATIEVVGEIVEASAGRIEVLVDGGFRRGSDILKALALGAKAVLVGRPPLWGLGAFGARGVQRVLEILQAELEIAMGNSGCSRISDINQELVVTDFP